MHGLSPLRHRLGAQDGFTMIVVLGVLLVVSLLSIGAYQAVMGDVGNGNYAEKQKDGYDAAEAGLTWFQANLTADPSLATQCPNGTGPINDPYSPPGTGTPRRWQVADPSFTAPPGNPDLPTAQFSIEQLPANGYTKCNAATPEASLVDATTGLMRVRITGAVFPTTGASPDTPRPRRSIVATFRRRGFLDFLWLTDLETNDPPLSGIAYGVPSGSNPDLPTWEGTNCTDHWWETRNAARYPSTGTPAGLQNKPCADIAFRPGDQLNGPVHSNDSFLMCGNPSFGAGGSADAVETSAPAVSAVRDASVENPVWWGCASGTALAPAYSTPLRTGVAKLQLPPSNSALATAPNVTTYTGKTTIVFTSDGKMTVNGGAPVSQPVNGVLYVKNGIGGCGAYKPMDTENSLGSCGEVRVKGTYTQSMTIAAESDVVVTGDLLKGGGNDPLLGLVANNYVRVYHPITPPGPAVYNASGSCTSTAASANGANTDLTIQAAILTLNHSFLVDNWTCGPRLGTLHVYGAIAQKYRGSVSKSTTSGYTKDYTYDPRLKYREPPSFIDPLSAPWRLVRVNEQVPAT